MRRLSEINEGIMGQLNRHLAGNIERKSVGIFIDINGERKLFKHSDFNFISSLIPWKEGSEELFVKTEVDLIDGPIYVCCEKATEDNEDIYRFRYVTEEHLNECGREVNEMNMLFVSNYLSPELYIKLLNKLSHIIIGLKYVKYRTLNDNTFISFEFFDTNDYYGSGGNIVKGEDEANKFAKECLEDKFTGSIIGGDVEYYIEEYGDDWIDYDAIMSEIGITETDDKKKMLDDFISDNNGYLDIDFFNSEMIVDILYENCTRAECMDNDDEFIEEIDGDEYYIYISE